MAYDYQTERESIFTDQGQRQFLQVRDKCFRMCVDTGAFRMDAVLCGMTCDTWEVMACVDRMIELGELREVTPLECAGQHRVFERK